MCSKTLLVALLLLAATQNAAIMPSLRNRNDFYNDSRNDPSGVTAATVAAAAAAAAATTWRASSINHTDNSGSQNASNHISLQSLRSLRAGRSDASQQSLVSLEKFCARTLLPHVSHRGDSLLRVSANLKAVLPNQLTIDELNKTLLAEARQLGITINPPGWSSSRSDTTLQHSDANAAQKILTRVWTQAGIVDRDTIAFLERALGFCRSASLATERLPSGFEHHRFCRRVGFVHIPKTGGSSIMHVLSNISLAYNPRMLLTSKKLYIGMHHMFSRTGRPMKNHQTALRQALHFGETTWDNAYTFAALRDPFDLVVSHFMYTAGYRCAHEPVIHALSPIDIAFACANLLGEPNRWDLSTLFSVTSEFGSLGGAASVSKLDIQRAFFNLWLLSHDIKASAPPREVTASAGAGLNLTKAPFGFLCDSYSICKVPQHVWQFVADNLIDKSHPQTDRHAQKADHDDNRAYVGANLETRVRQILEQTGGLEFSASQYSWVRDVQPEIGLGTMHRKLLVDELVTMEPSIERGNPFSELTNHGIATAWTWIRDRACFADASDAHYSHSPNRHRRLGAPVHDVTSTHAPACTYFNPHFNGALQRKNGTFLSHLALQNPNMLADVVQRRFADDFKFGFWNPNRMNEGASPCPTAD